MKAIKCELCGSADFKKEDGMFVCQYCRVKYTPDEAKKIMVDGVVKVSVDTDKKESNLAKLAKREFNDKNYDEAYNYYNKLLEIDSENWEYVYKKGLCAAWKSTLDDFNVIDAANASKNALSLIQEKDIEIKNLDALKLEMADQINKVNAAMYMKAINPYKNHFEFEKQSQELWDHLAMIINGCEMGVVLVENEANEEMTKIKRMLMENIVLYCAELCKARSYMAGYMNNNTPFYRTVYCDATTRARYVAIHEKYVAEIKKYNPNYVPPQIMAIVQGCYVATCVYGSYDCPEVWTLRRFRDYSLAEHALGRAFIKVYYFVSPKAVKAFGRTRWFNFIFKKSLDKFVARLQNKGYSSERYEDKM